MCAIVTNEDWKFVKGYENIYQVSNFGRVRSFTRTVDRKNGNSYYSKGQTLRPTINGSSFVVSLYRDLADGTKERKTYRLNRLVMEAFNTGETEKRYIIHKDGNKLNNRADNLYYSDTKDGTSKNVRQDEDIIYNNEVGRSYVLTENGYIPLIDKTKVSPKIRKQSQWQSQLQ